MTTATKTTNKECNTRGVRCDLITPDPGEVRELKVILKLSGRAGQVFLLFDLFCQEYGAKTLGELVEVK